MAYVQVADMILRLCAAALLGGLIGLDREIRHKPIGLRTFMLISTGAALFTLLAMELAVTAETYAGIDAVDPTRVVQGIIAGIGLLGVGTILHRGETIRGATTGAGVWLVGSIGVACGLGFYLHAVAATTIAIIVLAGIGALERTISRRSRKHGANRVQAPDPADDRYGTSARSYPPRSRTPPRDRC